MTRIRDLWILWILAFGWYISVGVIVSKYTEMQIKQECPGHRTAFEKYPLGAPLFSILSWPIGAPVVVVGGFFPAVCGRFD